MKEEIEKCIEVLKNGGTILYPTDTVWGIGCDASNVEAVEKVLKIKNRPSDKSIIILLDDDRKLNRYVKDIPDSAWDVLDCAVKPTTIVYPEGINLAPNVLSKDKSIGIRICKDEFCNQLIKRLNKPLVSTSANISGSESAKSFKDIDPSILSKVDYVVNLRRNEDMGKKPSSIIKIGSKGEIEILRK